MSLLSQASTDSGQFGNAPHGQGQLLRRCTVDVLSGNGVYAPPAAAEPARVTGSTRLVLAAKYHRTAASHTSVLDHGGSIAVKLKETDGVCEF